MTSLTHQEARGALPAHRHRFTDAADGRTYLALHGGLDNAQRVFAAFDQPDLKAPFTTAVAAPGPGP